MALFSDPTPTFRRIPVDDVRDYLNRNGGPTRLDELRDDLHADQDVIDDAILHLVEKGEIGLLPVGDVIHIKRAD